MDSVEANERAPLRVAGGVKVTGRQLWFDATEKKPLTVLSSALSAPLIIHERTVLHTRVLAVHPRRHTRQAFLSTGYGETVLLGDWDITLLPSGFNPGAAQIRVRVASNSEEQTLLYVGPFNTRPTRVTEDFQGVKADILGVDLDWVKRSAQLAKREAVVQQVLQRVQATLDDGDLPLLFVPPFGIPEELVLGLGDDAPPILVHDGVMTGLRALKRSGFTLSKRILPLKRSHLLPGHAVMIPEQLRAQMAPRPKQRVFVFDGEVSGETPGAGRVDESAAEGSSEGWRFPRFNEPDIQDLRTLIAATEPREIVYMATQVGAWRGVAPEPEGVTVHYIEKEAQMGLL
jgi:hypothetical protein